MVTISAVIFNSQEGLLDKSDTASVKKKTFIFNKFSLILYYKKMKFSLRVFW